MNLLITGAWPDGKNNIEILEKMGHAVCYLQDEKAPLPCAYAWVEGVVCNGLFLHHPIERFEKLRYIQLTSAGLDRVPMEYITKQGIELHNARGVYSIPMAEYAVGGVLQLYKQFPVLYENQKKHTWNKLRTLREIHQSTVCIIGCGSVGTECAKRFQAFGAKVIGIDLLLGENTYYDEIRIIDELDVVLSASDVVILALPLTAQTYHLMNEKRLSLLKEGSIIVNIARGDIMDYAAFIALRQAGRDIRAVLDVFDTEPLAEDSPLWDMEGVVVTPHNSFVGVGNQERLNKVILDHLK